MPDLTGERPDVPAAPGAGQAADAARTLRELDEIGARSRRVARAGFSRAPLTLWGVAWMLGYPTLDLLPWTAAIPIGVALAVLALAGGRWARSREVVSDPSRPVGAGWWALMACSPLLVLVIVPAPARTILLFLGALWGVALLLLAVASADRMLGVVGALVVVAAAVVRPLDVPHGLLVFGLVAGAAMVALGVVRMRAPR